MSLARTLAAKSLLVISIPLSFQIGLIVALGALQISAEQSLKTVQKSLQLSQTLSATLQDLSDIRAGSLQSGLSYIMSGSLLASQRHGVQQLQVLKGLLAEQPAKLKAIDEIESHARSGPELISRVNNYDEIGPLDILVRQLVVDSNVLAAMVDEEECKTSAAMHAQQSRDALYQGILCGGTAIELALIAVAFFWLRRDVLERLALMKENSVLVAMGKPLKPRLAGTDELARLDGVFHDMAAEIVENSQIQNILVENIRAVICSLDSKLTFKETNSASASIFGYEPEELIGMRLANLVTAADAGRATDVMERAQQAPSQAPFELRITRKDGIELDTLWSVSWSQPDSTYICAVHDNTVRKEADRHREGLLQLVSADLRGPLEHVEKVLGAIGASKFGPLSERGLKLVATASNATGQMLAITNDLLDLNHLEAGTLKVYPQPVLVSTLIDQAVDASLGMAQNFGIHLKKETVDATVMVDRARMVQVLTNLISNAAKFSPKDSTVTIAAAHSGGEVRINVIDSGRGIAADVLPNIFDRFRQVEGSDETVLKGAGLGLAITKELVRLNGGTINVDSVPDKGSTFTVHLPTAHAVPERGSSDR